MTADSRMVRIKMAIIQAQVTRRDATALTNVSVHVGTDIWDWLRSMANRPSSLSPSTEMLAGIPLVHDSLRDPEYIAVHASTQIY